MSGAKMRKLARNALAGNQTGPGKEMNMMKGQGTEVDITEILALATKNIHQTLGMRPLGTGVGDHPLAREARVISKISLFLSHINHAFTYNTKVTHLV